MSIDVHNTFELMYLHLRGVLIPRSGMGGSYGIPILTSLEITI